MISRYAGISGIYRRFNLYAIDDADSKYLSCFAVRYCNLIGETMIFFGTKGKAVSGQCIEGIECPSCGNNQFITFGVLRYFHLYWIPVIPTTKTVGIECTHCKKTLVGKELPPELSKQIKSTLFTKKKTLPMFSGLIIIAFLMLFGVFTIQQDNAQEAAYINQPAVNDIYIVNFTKIFTDTDPKFKYGAMRVKYLSSTQIELQVSSMAYNKASGVLDDIRDKKSSSDSYYENELLYIDIDKLKEMKSTGAIYSVERI